MRGSGYFVVMFFCFLAFMGSTEGDLQMGFYSKSCPNAEKIVQDYVNSHIHNAPSLAASILRMHFHDCFVRVCVSRTNQTEKLAVPNSTLRGFDFIDRVKSLLEAACPGVVSCADVIALVARDGVVATGGPSWRVHGRETDNLKNQLHNSTETFSTGLNLKDLVLLSGAHTIGVAHCTSFSNRLYNFTGVLGSQDPALDSEYAAVLKARNQLLKRRGLFQSDSALTTNSTALSLVNQLLQGSLKSFFAEFARSMEKMGRIKVKTGKVGEIRKQCAVVNG
uniref:peroxidase n=1 Tax=Salix viminalis TaxID=40686 RepID=A0A6N2N6N6_SALVM